MPLVIRGRTWGAVTFATLKAPRTWTAEVISRLRVVAVIFANVLARKQGDEALRRAMVENSALRARLRDENSYLRQELNTLVGAPAIVGNSPGIRRVLEQVRQVSASDASVLLLGEIGTGKSVLAHRIHDLSARRDRALVRVNCASLSADSVQGDLFGQYRGAYVAGETKHTGLLELANGSTVFLDEVTDLPTETQASLARVLQSHEIQPLGTSHPIKVDLRVIAASRRDLLPASRAGRSGTICTTGSMSFRSTSRRCASASTTSRCWCGASSTNFHRRMERRSRRSTRSRWPSCSAIPGRATRANCAMSSNAR